MAMTMTGEFLLPADKATVWARLNDAATLQASIPGCESLEKLSDTEFRAIAHLPGADTARIWEPEPTTIYTWGGNA